MKKILIWIPILFATLSYSQELSDCNNLTLKTNSEMKSAEPCIKKLSDYALNQPMIGCNEEGHLARKIVYNWVEGTDDYTFSLNKQIMKIFNDDNLLLYTTYTACLAKAALEKEKNFEEYALELFIIYIKKSENKVDKSKVVNKLLEDWKNKEIKRYLK